VSENTVEQVRVCRECGEEYRPEILVCADCGGELETRLAGEPLARPEPEAPRSNELEGYRAVFTGSRATDLVPLCDRLREMAIDFRLVEQPASAEGGPARYLILVKEGEAAAALQSLAALIAPHETGGDMRAIEDGFDPQQGYLKCPACGTKTPAAAKECPECGLGLGLADE
jgi:ribosomal protein L37E